MKIPTSVKLGVNVDHIATLRQARRELEPDPAAAANAALAEEPRARRGGMGLIIAAFRRKALP